MEVVPSLSSVEDAIPHIGRASVRERVQEVLTDLILRGTLKPGDQFPSEAKLAKSFGVSRVVLREAMKALEARGLVEIIQGKGILVKEPGSSYASEALSLLLRRNVATMMDLWQARVMLETGITELACQKATPEQLETLREAISSWAEPNADLETLVAEDERFHTILVQATDNPVLELLMETIGDLLLESRRATLASGPGPDLAGHTAILEALVNRDPDAAREAMLAHLQHARDDLILAGGSDWVARGHGREAI